MNDRPSGQVNVNRTRGNPSWLLPVAILLAIVLLAVLALAFRGGTPPASTTSPTPTATATVTTRATPTQVAVTTTAPAATTAATTTVPATQTARLPRECENLSYRDGDPPGIVPPRKSGDHMQVAVDWIRPSDSGGSRWATRFFVPFDAPGDAVVPLSASVTGPSGPLTMGRYEYGPPMAGTVPATEPVTVQRCQVGAPPGLARGTVVIIVESSRVTSGTYTLTWRGLRLPEGGTRDETWTLALTCDASGTCR